MKAIVLVAASAGIACFAQQQPEVTQTSTGITIRLDVPGGVQPGMVPGQATVAFIGAQPIGGDPIKGAPYSAEAVTETTQTLADGNRIVQRRSSMQYRDGLGRERREESLPILKGAAQQSGKLIIISDPVAGANYTLNPQARTAERMPGLSSAKGRVFELRTPAGQKFVTQDFPGPQAGISVSPRMILNGTPPAEPPRVEDLGSQMIEGVLAVGKRETRMIPAGQIGNTAPIQIVDETWYSSDLHMNVMTRHSDPREGETVYKLTNIQRTEPDPSLFQVPADYQIHDAGKIVTTVSPKE